MGGARGARVQQAGTPGTRSLDPGRGLLAALLAWLFPGAGHFFLGARREGAVYLALVLGALGLGVGLGGNLAMVDPRLPVLSGLHVFSNLGLGPMEPLLRTTLYGAPTYVRHGEAPPALGPAPVTRRWRRSFARWSAYGNGYMTLAGLMNLLVILDAWDIGSGRKPHPGKKGDA